MVIQQLIILKVEGQVGILWRLLNFFFWCSLDVKSQNFPFVNQKCLVHGKRICIVDIHQTTFNQYYPILNHLENRGRQRCYVTFFYFFFFE